MTPAEKDAAVLAALDDRRMTLWGIVNAAYSHANGCWPYSPRCLPQVLRRIEAVKHADGTYSAPLAPDADGDAERPKALPAFVCAACHGRTADYAGSRASGDGRKCRGCVGRP